MTGFADSYLGQLRRLIGPRLVMMPGVRVVVEREDGAVLLHLRSDYRLWGFPGGVPDEGEGLAAVALRETLEETGIRPQDLVPFGFADDPAHEVWTYPNGDVCHYFTLLFHAPAFEGTAVADGDESLRVEWFKPENCPPLMPVMQRTLAAFLAYKRTGAFQMI
jgi:8-oxo-dGTP pyrophosphatase MutT (NUDIX family)